MWQVEERRNDSETKGRASLICDHKRDSRLCFFSEAKKNYNGNAEVV